MQLWRRMVTTTSVASDCRCGLRSLFLPVIKSSACAASRQPEVTQRGFATFARSSCTQSTTAAAAALKPLSRQLSRSSCSASMTAALEVVQAQHNTAVYPEGSTVAIAAAAKEAILQQAACEQHSTKLFTIDASTLPPVAAPDAAAVTAILTATAAPDLSPSSCPHLYYSLPGQQQQQQQVAAGQTTFSSEAALQEAAELLRSGQPVAIPTETVYGLAANALSASAVSAVFAAKGRPSDNPLIVHISDLSMLAQLYPQQQQQQQQQQQDSCCQPSTNGEHSNSSTSSSSSGVSFIPMQYHRLIAAFWPGPLTLLLPASPLIPAAVTAGLPTVAVRMPAHPVARALIAAAGVPLAAPSANTSGRPSPTTAQHVMQDLAGRVAAVVDGGACACGVESTVLDGLREPPVVLRPGGVTAEQLGLCVDMQGLQVYQRDFTDKQLEATPTTPGMKYRHYSPTAPLLLLDPTAAWQTQQQQQQGQVRQQQEQQQQAHNALQQLVVDATQQLLQSLWQAQQQQQQQQAAACNGQGLQPAEPAQQPVVLLSTCSSGSNGSSTKVGWTEASWQRIQQQQQQQQHEHNLPQPLANGNSAHITSSSSSTPEVLEYVLGSWQQPELVAQQVFAALRAADAVDPALIIAQGLPPEGPALAIMNRLQKAASQHVQVSVASN